MIKQQFLDYTKKQLSEFVIGEDTNGERICFADAVRFLGIDFDEYCEKLVDSELDDARDYIEFVLNEALIDNQPCPNPTHLADRIIQLLHDEQVAWPKQNLVAAIPKADPPKNPLVKTQSPQQEALIKATMAATICVLYMDLTLTLVLAGFTYVFARLRWI